MPIIEPTTLDLRQYSLRHVGPKAVVFPDTPGKSFTVLNRADMVARPLPVANIPNSVDFASGKWTGRLYDAGDGNVAFPNKEASDGVAWRDRFDPTNKLQWLEVYLDEYLEFVQCVTKVTPDRNQVLVEGYDGFQMTKSAYHRDWTVVMAPRDVIERGTQLWMGTSSDGFPAGSLSSQWTDTSSGGSTSVLPSGGLNMTVPSFTTGYAQIQSAQVTVPATGVWSSTASAVTGGSAPPPAVSTTIWLPIQSGVLLEINESTGDNYAIGVELIETSVTVPGDTFGLLAQLWRNSVIVQQILIPFTANAVGLLLESDGEYVWGFVDGQLVGCVRRSDFTTTYIETIVRAQRGFGDTGTMNVVLTEVLTKACVPFLMQGTDKGDYVLPGDASTYPNGGLHARYYNDLDLQADTYRLYKIMAPSRSQAYGSSAPAEYQNQQDSQINSQANYLPGAATSNWSCKWFGAIWLKLSAGSYTFSIVTPGTSAVRVWVGKTRFQDRLVDQWAWNGASTYSFTVSATALAGALSYGNGTVQRDGWYPIRVEYAVDSTIEVAPVLNLTNSPASYTDPGGTAIASGAQTTPVPATSLSPLGMIDQRYQATSHYDIVQKTAIAVGYQFAVEPKQLESGLFPGVLAPRLQEGAEYDTIVEPDNNQRNDALINYSALTDGTDQSSSIQGNGAGFQSGNTGQLQGLVFDAPTIQNALFDMQGWQDNADIAYLSLLQTTLNSQLGLKLTPWVVVSADPTARERLAGTWPLGPTVSQMRWRPGESAWVWARDIAVQDTVPRQLLVVTRNIHPNGTTSTQVSFAARPKGITYANRQALSAAIRPQRNNQRQLHTLLGAYQKDIAVGGGQLPALAYSTVPLLPSDQLLDAHVRISQNSANNSTDIEINGVLQGANLGGPWIGTPLTIPILGYATQNGIVDNRLLVRLKNLGAGTTTYDWQLVVTVLR